MVRMRDHMLSWLGFGESGAPVRSDCVTTCFPGWNLANLALLITIFLVEIGESGAPVWSGCVTTCFPGSDLENLALLYGQNALRNAFLARILGI